MGTVLIQALQLLCCLSLLVVLHEGGHFLFSKIFKVRVEKFYMFFNPKFHLFSTKDKWFAKRFPRIAANETEYGIGWIPLGGYVKIAGMIDESMDKEQLKQPAKPDEFRAQPIWKRFFIMVGGVLMNLITALVIYCVIMLVYGRDVVPMENVKDGFSYNAEAQKMGFRNGDIPVAVNGEKIAYWSPGIINDLAEAETVTVMRDGKEVTFQVPAEHPNLVVMNNMMGKGYAPKFITPYIPAEIDSVMPNSPAAKAGLTKGCKLLAIDGCRVTCSNDVDSVVMRRNEKIQSNTADASTLKEMKLVYIPVGASTADTLVLQLDAEHKAGFVWNRNLSKDVYKHLDYNLATCIPAGVQYGWDYLVNYVRSLKYVFTSEGAKSVGSFISIGSVFPEKWDWLRFWELTAFISIILAVMNILPIPGLDGGHVMFLLLEAIMRRPLSEKAQTICEYVGMGLLILLMIWAFGNDLMKFVF